MNKYLRFLFLSVFLPFIILMTGSCELFDVSLVEYLREGRNSEKTDGLWVYMAAASGNDGNSGQTPADPVKTLGRALEIWADEGSTEARIMLTEDIKVSGGYSDPDTFTGKGLVDFSTNLSWSDITSITLVGSGSGKIIDNENVSRPVIYIGTAGKSITLKNLTITGGNSNGAGIYIEHGAALTIAEGVIVTGNEAPVQGGGVYVDGAGSEFIMKSGEIHSNKALNASAGKGGGVYVGSNATFIMEGGIIRDNESGNDGGGVYVSDSNSKVRILNGIAGGSSVGVKNNRAKYGAGVYVGAHGILELGIDGADQPYPYIQYNTSSAGGTGGGIVINGAGSKAIFHHGTVSNNNGATLGGGILIVNGELDMRGGTVTGNTATTGPGITVEDAGLFIMRKNARVLDPDNPVHLYGTSPKGYITIGNGGFTSGYSTPPGIAIVTTKSGYGSGDVILKQEESGSFHVQDYYHAFKINGSYSLNNSGALP